MVTLLDQILSKVDSFSERLGPVTTLIDMLVSHIAPTTAAKACGEGYFFCGTVCNGLGACCGVAPNCAALYSRYALNAGDCASGHYTTTCYLHCGC